MKIDGIGTLRSKAGASIKIGGLVQTEAGMTDQGGFFEKLGYVPCEVSGDFLHMSDTDLKAIQDFRGGTLTFECDTGNVYTSSPCSTKEVGPMKDGVFTASFMGQPAKS